MNALPDQQGKFCLAPPLFKGGEGEREENSPPWASENLNVNDIVVTRGPSLPKFKVFLGGRTSRI